MNKIRTSITLLLTVALASSLFVLSANAQEKQADALTRGFRTGYSDGYAAGKVDAGSNSSRDFRSRLDYQHADRGYNSSYGSIDDFRDGYQQGFEAGYNAGYDNRPFESSAPPDIARRAQTDVDTIVVNPNDTNNNNSGSPDNSIPVNSAPAMIPRDTIMRIELLNNLSTDASQKGDQFQARVIEPREYEGATIDGRVDEVKRPGKVKGTALLQLSFNQIRLTDGRTSGMSAQVIEVVPMSASRNVDKVDPEGGVKGQSSTKSDAKKVGGAAGVGALIGLIVGGGTGAAIGATIGAGVGTAGVLTSKGKDLYLYQGQHLRIRTAGDARID